MSIAPRDDRLRPVLLVGLTGGIATGKSTVSGMFRELGLPVVDADGIVHELLAAGGAAVSPVRRTFGDDVIEWSGGIDRKKLGTLVFDDDTARRKLEQIIHPLVVARSQERLDAVAESESAHVVIYDAALLVETGRHEEFHRLVVVTADQQVQLQRLLDRDQISVDQAGARIRSQLPLREKTALADYVIDNSHHWHQTRERVNRVHELLLDDAAFLCAGDSLPVRR